jgi:hypothetical protein
MCEDGISIKETLHKGEIHTRGDVFRIEGPRSETGGWGVEKTWM